MISLILKNVDKIGILVAVRTRLELAASAVTGRRSNQLSYRTTKMVCMVVPARLELATSTL